MQIFATELEMEASESLAALHQAAAQNEQTAALGLVLLKTGIHADAAYQSILHNCHDIKAMLPIVILTDAGFNYVWTLMNLRNV